MKKIINLFFVCISILTTLSANAQTPAVPAGYSVRQVATGGLLAGQLLDGIVADPISGNVYVAGVSSTSSSNFNLYKITPAGVVSFIRNYAFAHNEVVKMAFNVNDGHIYTLDGNSGSIYKIDPVTGTSSIYASNIGNGRYGLNFDPAGNLIIGFESMFDFYKVTPAGKINMGHVSASVPNGNHGDAFGIQPNGNYVVYVDCGGENNYAINTAGHTEGSNYSTIEWTSPTNIFSSLMPGGCGYSNGAIDPNTGDVYSSISNFGSGNTKILFTAENGGPTTAFVNDGSAIMDLCFGKESNTGNCNSLYFIDRNLNTVFEVPMNNCCSPSPTATTVTGGGTFCGSATIIASGGDGGVIYFQGNSNGTSTADSATSKVVTSSGTYYFRAQIPGGCWGKAGSVIVNIKPTPTAPIISPAGNIEYCQGNSTTTILSIPSIPFSPVTTYNIPLANLVNVPNSCGGGSQYGSGQVGFTWNDAGNGLVANVQIKFSVGVECSVGAHTTSFNSVASNGFSTTTGWCSCSAPSTPQIFTVNFSPTNYNVGGANTFLMSANTFGFFPAAALGGNYAQVIVTYAAPAAVWSPGGQTTSSITVSPASTSTYTVSVTGGNGCSSQSEKTVTVKVCNQAPVAVCKNISLSTDNDCAASANAIDFDGGSTDPDGDSLIFGVSPAGPFAIGVTNVTVTVTDPAGLSSSCTAMVNVHDNVAPVALTQNITVQLGATGTASISAADVNNGSTDACGIASIGVSPADFTCANVGSNIVTLTVTDNHGNVSTQTSTVTVHDNVAPIALTQNIIVQLDASGNALITAEQVDNGSTDACGIASLNVSQNNFTCANVGDNVVTLTVTDNNGNVSTETATVTIQDKIAHVVVCRNITVQLNASGQAAITATDVNNGSNDACGIASITIDKSTFDCSNLGANIITLTVTDLSGNISSCQATITVEDKVAPVALCKNVTVNLDANGQAFISANDVNNGSNDACGIASLSVNPSSFNCSKTGNNNVVLTVADANGNSSSCTAVVTVKDVTAPVIVCQSDITVGSSTTSCSAKVAFNLPQVSDNCSGGSNSNPIVNGSFESGNYNGWSLSSTSGTCGLFAIGNTGQTISNGQIIFDYANNMNEQVISPGFLFTPAPSDGTKMGVFLQRCSSTHSLYQNVTLPSGTISLCLDLGYKNHAGNFSSSQFIAIELRNPSTNAIITTLFKTTTGSQAIRPFSNMCFDISAYAGQYVKLQIIDASIQQSQLDVFFDNIKIVGGTSLVQTAGLPSQSQFPIGTTTNTFVATDSYGNSSTCSFNVTVNDNVAPIALTKNITVQLNATGEASITATQVDNGSFDACGIATSSVLPNSFTCANFGNNTVTLTVTDNNGNVSTETATVLVQDNVAPVALTQNITVSLDAAGNGSITATQIDNGSSDACGIASLSVSSNSFTCANVGNNTVTLTVTDNNGNVSTETATVLVQDNVAPVSLTQNITVSLDAAGNGSITATQVENGSSDACGIASLSVSPNSFTCANVGNNTVTLTVTDNNGNVSTETATVLVQDNVAPLALTHNITVQLDAAGAGSITSTQIDNGSSDACGIASLNVSSNNFTCANVGNNTVTLTVTDNNGNVATETAIVLVQDNVAPVALTQNITVSLDAAGNGSITATQVDNGSSDACGIASLSVSPNSFTCANVGNNTVTLTVTDNNGNVSTETATVLVQDNVAPVALTQNITVSLDVTGNGSITATQVDNGSSDACGIASLSVSPNSFTCANVGNNTVTLTVTDNNGNVSTETATVLVQDNVAPLALTQNITVQLDAAGNASITSSQVDNGSSDPCGIASLSVLPNSFTCANVGNNTVTLTVTDNNGNVSTETATVLVQDNVAPVALTQNITVSLDAAGTSSITATQIDNGSNDNCSIATYSLNKTSFNCSNVGVNAVVLTVTDVNGNSSTGAATVTVQDNVSPTVITKNVTITLVNATATISPAMVNNGSFDNCSIADIIVSKNTFDCLNIGANTVTLTVTDVNGNSSSATATVNVIGAIPTATIAQGLQPGFTQGGAIVLTASSATAVSYAWAGGPADSIYNVYNSGTYTVTAINSYGCTVNASSTVSYTASNLLSNYIIIGKREVEVKDHSIVYNGGIGVTSTNGEAEFENFSKATASGTFVRAKQIQVQSNSTVTTKILTALPTSILPVFLYNTYCNSNNQCKHSHHNGCGDNDSECNGNGHCNHSHHGNCGNNNGSNNNININKNTTVTITDSIFGTVNIGKNAIVTFTSPRLYMKKLEVKEGATVKFAQCAVLRVCNDVKIKESGKFNTVNSSIVTLYVEKNFDVEQGSQVTANVFALDDIQIKGKSSAPTVMKGMFIGDEVKAEKYVNFYWNTTTYCSNGNYKSAIVAAETELIETSFDVNVYPNPTVGDFKIQMSSASSEPFRVDVYDMKGGLIESNIYNNSNANEVWGSNYANGVYLIKITQGENIKNIRLVRTN